jgi:hypothetical protein
MDQHQIFSENWHHPSEKQPQMWWPRTATSQPANDATHMMYASMARIVLIGSEIWSRKVMVGCTSYCWHHLPHSGCATMMRQMTLLIPPPPFSLTRHQSSCNSAHTFNPSSLFGVSTFAHSAMMMNANEEYESRFLLFPIRHSTFMFCMQWWDDEMSLITNPSHWEMRWCGREQVDINDSAVHWFGTDSWFKKFRNNIRPTRIVLSHKPFGTESDIVF